MISVHAYLSFNGNCREAMSFYKDCLGGNLSFQFLSDSSFSHHMPEEMKKLIVHASLRSAQMVIMASDMVGDKDFVRGNSVSLMLHCSSEAEMMELYRKLSWGGEQTQTPAYNIGGLMGNLTDKYGHHWILSFQEKEDYRINSLV